MAEEQPDDITVGTIGQTEIVAASLARGRTQLGGVDAFVANLSDFDRRARVCLTDATTTVDTHLYLDYVTAQVMAWTPEEIRVLAKIIEDIDARLSSRWCQGSYQLPSHLYLVKTTGQEEGRAAYTRGADTIVLPAGKVGSALGPSLTGDPLFPRSNTTGLRDILLHELFHVISKNSPDTRRALYELVGYTQLAGGVPLPPVPWPEATSSTRLPDLKVTNPDTPHLDVYLTLEVPESPGAAGPLVERSLLPVLVAGRPYQGGSFFPYITWYFMAIRQDGGGWVPECGAGSRPLLYEMSRGSALWERYLDQVGRNAEGELFHPDEIIAQNFVFAALLPSCSLLCRVGGVLA